MQTNVFSLSIYGFLTPVNSFLGASRWPSGRAATIHSPYDTICIAILASQYDTYRDTLFRLEVISICMRIILWWSTKVLTRLQSLFEMVHSHSQ